MSSGPNPGEGALVPAEGEILAFSFADPAAEVFGVARWAVVRASASSSPMHAVVLVVCAGDRAPVVLGSEQTAAPSEAWEQPHPGATRMRVGRANGGLSLRASGPGARVELEFAPDAEAARIEAADRVSSVAGIESETAPCRVTGAVETQTSVQVDGFGQRTRERGETDWRRLTLRRALALWSQGPAVLALAARPAETVGHQAETVAGFVFDGEPRSPQAIADTRLSATTNADGGLVRAGLELWESQDTEFPRRAAAEAVAGATVATAGHRLQVAFLRGGIDGRPAVGVYELLAGDAAPGPIGADG